MTDHFEGIDKLVKEAPHTEGAPNFRRMSGFSRCLEPIMKKYGEEKVFYWANLRQEPVVYVNDKPYSARDPDKLQYHLEISNPEEVAKFEESFMEELKRRGEEYKFYQDQYGEHPEDRAAKMELLSEKMTQISTLTTIFNGLKEKVEKVQALRIPMEQDKAPQEDVFDQILGLLKSTSASTPIVFNCQGGINRTTTAMVIASLIKEFQLASESNHMKGIVPDDILEALKKKKLGLPGI